MLRSSASHAFKRLVRFAPRSDPCRVLIGQPLNETVDVGAALYHGQDVEVEVFSGTSVLSPGGSSGTRAVIDRVFSPLQRHEVGTIRCLGLNYKQHAEEVGMPIPTIPTMFMKPATALADPWPAPSTLPKLTQMHDCGDYESELAIVIGRTAKDVSESEAMHHVLGYTAANDISSRSSQFAQSQWNFSKGFDASCPLGPVLVSSHLIPDPSKLRLRGFKNGELMQDCGIDDMIFSIPSIISFLSQSTTIPAGTIILTGTPAGVGVARKPKTTLKAGDVFNVQIQPYIGTLVNVFENEP